MDHPLLDLISAKIRVAEANGEFDNLPGAGKPLPPCDDPSNAVMHRILKENGAVPEFVALSQSVARLRTELRDCTDRDERKRLITEISVLEARIEQAKKTG